MSAVLLAFALLLQVIPVGLAILAIVHIVRSGSERFWIVVVLFFPLLGPILYFLVAGTLGAGGPRGGLLAEYGRKRAARRRIAEIEARLAHVHVPDLEAELADELAAIGRHREAEIRFRAALERLPDREDIAYGLALTLIAEAREAEAVPLLDGICRKDPRYHFGDAQLRLAQCLEQTGQDEREELRLRDLLSRSSLAEAQVRLAALLLRRGRRDEAVTTAAALVREAAGWPRYLRRQNRRWLSLSRRLASGRLTRIPSASALMRPPRVKGWMLVAGGTTAAAMFLFLATAGPPLVSALYYSHIDSRYRHVRDQLVELDRTLPAVTGDLTRERLDRYLRIRQRLAPGLAPIERLRAEDGKAVRGGQVLLWTLWPTHAPARALSAHAEFLDAAYSTLAAEECSPAELRAVAATVEWRFLDRPGAEVFALTFEEWLDLKRGRATVATPREQWAASAKGAAWWDTNRGNVDRIEALLRQRKTPLSASMVELLNPVRSRLSPLSPVGLETLAFLKDRPLHPWLDTMPFED